MNAEVISIGDEITSGQRLDTNSQWLSQRLGELGCRADFHTTVGDRLDANVQVFRCAIQRADVVVTSGGLGPTADDLTREALALAFNRPLRRDETALAHIRALFARRQRRMPERNVVQAMLPESATLIPNPHGTAPGIDLTIERDGRSACRLFALPGVPAEMREMFPQSVAPAIRSLQGSSARVIRHHCIKCFGVGESELEAMLPDLIRRGRIPSVGITASQATLTLRITAEAQSEADCREQMQPTLASIHRLLGELVFSELESDELQHAVVRMLRDRQQTLATVEADSGGLLSTWLSEADLPGEVYLGGWVVPRRSPSGPMVVTASQPSSQAGPAIAADSMWNQLWMPDNEEPAVCNSALAARQILRADFGLAVGRFPRGGAVEQPAGTVLVGLAGPDIVRAQTFPFAGHPDLLRARTVKHALNALRLLLTDCA